MLSAFVVGPAADRWGRKPALFVGAILTIVGVILQSAAVHIAMFVIGRIIIGLGTGVSACAGPTYLAETTAYKFRGIALGLFFDFFFVGKQLTFVHWDNTN